MSTEAERPWSRIAQAVIAAGLIAGILCSWPLWQAVREYPLAPLIPGADRLPPWVSAVTLGLLLVAAAAAPFRPQERWPAPVLIASAALLVALDQTRLQPWFYGYVALGGALAAGGAGGLDTTRLMAAAMYFWSGAHKLNLGFVHQTAPWLWSPLVHRAPGLARFVPPFAYAAPWVEIALGAMLLAPKTRRAAVVGVAAMHALILASIGPWALDWNGVVWPWNVAMALLVVSLFWNCGTSASRLLWNRGRPRLHAAALLLFVALPALSFAGLWDDELSFALYSGNQLFADVTVSRQVRERLPPAARQVTRPQRDGRFRLLFDEWAHQALQVPPHAAVRVHRSVARTLCALAADPAELELVLWRSSTFFYGPPEREVLPGGKVCSP